jgi:hypothetical protein
MRWTGERRKMTKNYQARVGAFLRQKNGVLVAQLQQRRNWKTGPAALVSRKSRAWFADGRPFGAIGERPKAAMVAAAGSVHGTASKQTKSSPKAESTSAH